MKTTAAILIETGRPLELVDLELPLLQPGQVLVEVAVSGICHTQLLEARGHRGPDPFLPHCLGHEASGVVSEVGTGVTKVAPGDRVVLSWIKGSGADVPGTQYRWGDKVVNSGAVTTFARHTVVSENRVSRLNHATLADDAAALLGCALPTGLGAVFHVADAQPGQSLLVLGAGGIGLCAIAAAAFRQCQPIVAIDVLSEKLVLAQQMGATHGLLVQATDLTEQLKQLSPRGWDIAIEASGRPSAMELALQSVRPQGGKAVIIGNARAGERLDLDPKQFNLGKRLLGTWGGDSQPDRDFDHYASLIERGVVPVKHLLTRRYTLENINQALDDLEAGRAARPLVMMHDD